MGYNMANQIDTSMYQPSNPMAQYQQMQSMDLMSMHNKMLQIQQIQQKLQNLKETNDMIRQVIGSHMNDPNISRESILKSIGDLVADSHGAISPQVGGAFMQRVPPDGASKDVFQSFTRQVNQEALSAEQQLAYHQGVLQQINDGLNTHIKRISGDNTVTEIATVQNQMTPAENASQHPVAGVDAKGRPVMGEAPLSSLVTPQGYANGLSPQANAPALQAYRQNNGMTAPAREGGPSTGANNNLQGYQQEVENDAAQAAPQVPASALRSNMPSPPPVTPLGQPPAANVPPGWHQTQLTPGTSDAMQHAGALAGDAEGNAAMRAQQLPSRLYQLKTALNGLQNSNTGPGTAETNAAKSFLLANVPFAKDLAPDAVNSVASYDEANKYLTQYAQSAAANFGPETDAKLAASLTGNANTHISSLAAQDVVKANIGLERMQAAQYSAWQQAKKSGQYTDADYNDFMANSGKTLDPRAFMLDVMSPQQRQGLFKTLESKGNEQDKTNFAASLELANKSGLMPAPSQQNPAQQSGGMTQQPQGGQ